VLRRVGVTNRPQASPDDERVLAVIGDLTRAGGMTTRRKTYSLIITDRRLVFAELTRDKLAASAASARDAARAQGKSIWRQWRAQMRAPSVIHETYRGMAPEAALAESPGNFAVKRSDIREVRVETGMVDEVRAAPDQVIIVTTSGTYRLRTGRPFSKVEEVFRTAGLTPT
jgi:hypothetical protein